MTPPLPSPRPPGSRLPTYGTTARSDGAGASDNNDIVTVRRQDTAGHGDVTAVLLDGERTVRRLRREDVRGWLMSHNSS
ncbi:LexA family protein [Streptomyces sp. NPDC001970]